MLRYNRLYLDSPYLKTPDPGNAGYDLPAYGEYQLYPEVPVVINTGISVEIPDGWVGLVVARSGMRFNFDIEEFGVGVIDSNYRGELRVKLLNHGDYREVSTGDRIAQLVIVPYFGEAVEEVAALTQTNRGTKGFGSSGR